jgi:aryl-phospho-beta-D-glucosidase BglC (GH1 family)
MKKITLFSFVYFIALSQVCGQRLQIQGKNLISTNGDTVILKGFNWGWWGLAQQSDAEEACAMGANVIRMPMRWYFGGGGNDQRDTTKPGNINPDGLALLDQQIQWCTDNHLWVILFGGSDRGAGDDNRNYWTDNSLKQQFIDMWQFLANRYKNTPYIAAYELLSEPHPKKPVTNAQLRSFYKELADSVRLIDHNTPVMIGANDHYDINLMDSIYTSTIPNLFYTFNYYLPTDYVKPDKRIQEGLPIVS